MAQSVLKSLPDLIMKKSIGLDGKLPTRSNMVYKDKNGEVSRSMMVIRNQSNESKKSKESQTSSTRQPTSSRLPMSGVYQEKIFKDKVENQNMDFMNRMIKIILRDNQYQLDGELMTSGRRS